MVLPIISFTFWVSSSSRLSLLTRVDPLMRKLIHTTTSEIASNSKFPAPLNVEYERFLKKTLKTVKTQVHGI